MNFADLDNLCQTDQFGKVSKVILESFLKFVSRAEDTGKRTEHWTQIQNESGCSAITELLKWITRLCQKPVLYSS